MEKKLTKRALKLLDPAQIAEDMSYTCPCRKACTSTWTRAAMTTARKHFFDRTLHEQLIFIYDILSATWNPDTNEVNLRIGGTFSFKKRWSVALEYLHVITPAGVST